MCLSERRFSKTMRSGNARCKTLTGYIAITGLLNRIGCNDQVLGNDCPLDDRLSRNDKLSGREQWGLRVRGRILEWEGDDI